MPLAVKSDLLLYADDTCLVYTGKDIKTIEEQLNTDFSFVIGSSITNSVFTLEKKKQSQSCLEPNGNQRIKRHCS